MISITQSDLEEVVVGSAGRYFGYGRVAYAHGLGIDDPLSVTRVEYSDSIPWPVRIVPSSNWAGRYDGGSGGECITMGPGGRQIRPVVWSPGEREGVLSPGWGEEGEQIVHCMEIDWPALGMWMNLDYKPSNFHGRKSWMGSLLQHGRDPSGQYYRRNRYVDASTGRFTQEDPIGLAGGLNLYGFAAGDPVSYADPFGLRVCFKGSRLQIRRLHRATETATGYTFELDRDNCVIESSLESDGTAGMSEIRDTFDDMVAHEELVYDIRYATAADGQAHSFFGRYRDGHGYVVGIVPSDLRLRYDSPRGAWGCLFPVQTTRFTLAAIIAHELIGHGWGTPRGLRRGRGQRNAIRIENQYHRAHNEPTRCN